MPAPRGNRYAAKPEEEKFTESLFVRMTAAEKKLCHESSGDSSVSGWARKSLLLLVSLIPTFVQADLESSLGKSPNGRFELLLTAESAKDFGQVIVRDLKNGTNVEIDSGQGYGFFPSGGVEATWKGASEAFAITMRGTKRTWHTDVYLRDGKGWQKLDFPPYVANILGRQGVINGGRSFRESFGGFGEGQRFTLISHIEPDWQELAKMEKESDWKPTKQTEWKITLEYRYRQSPNCSLLKIEPFKKATGQAAAVDTATGENTKSKGEKEAKQKPQSPSK
jgi:hypothetical protein